MKTIQDWHKKVRDAFEALDVAMRGELPGPGDSIEVGNLRYLAQKLDNALFDGWVLTFRPSRDDLLQTKPGRVVRYQNTTLTIEDLDL